MRRVDGYYLYQVGAALHPLNQLTAYPTPGSPVTTIGMAKMALYVAESWLEPLIYRSVYQLKTSAHPGQSLLKAIRELKAKLDQSNDFQQALDWGDIYPITAAMQTFEAVLGAELALLPLYVVSPKAGFDTGVLIENGARCFPEDVQVKAPEAVPDLIQGTRCIAFEMFTAAGFHLHRANEAVLHRYWDAVTCGARRPTSRNMGDYLNEMTQRDAGDGRVRSALKDLKDLHRNPLIHPEHSLESADEAIALMNGVHTVIVYMLKEIPTVAPAPPTLIPGAAMPPQQTATTSALFSAAQLS